MRKNKKIVKFTAIVLAISLMVSMLAACSGGAGQNQGSERVLRIANTLGYQAEDDYFRSQFTELFEFSNPNITIEVESAMSNRYRYGAVNEEEEEHKSNAEILKEMMTGSNPPDVVMISLEELPQFVEENLLVDLEPLMKNNDMSADEFAPAVIEGLKRAGEGKLYALAPMFSSSALIYNKGIFDAAGVAYPEDDMTWDEIFDLARLVNKPDGDKPVHGFSFSQYSYGDMFNDMSVYANQLELNIVDDEGKKMVVNSDQWEKVWKKMIDLKTEKLVPGTPNYENWNEEGGPFQYHSFLSGKTAMSIAQYYDLNEIINANKNADSIENYTPIEWDVVTFPIHPEAPNVGGNMWMNGIMAINVNAQNQDDAWDFIEFINGKDWAKLRSKSSQQLVSRIEYNKVRDGLDYNLNAFYKLMPAWNMYSSKPFQENPNIWQVQQLGFTKFQEVAEGKKTVKQGLQEWENEGNLMLQQLEENPDMGVMPIDTRIEESTVIAE